MWMDYCGNQMDKVLHEAAKSDCVMNYILKTFREVYE